MFLLLIFLLIVFLYKGDQKRASFVKSNILDFIKLLLSFLLLNGEAGFCLSCGATGELSIKQASGHYDQTINRSSQPISSRVTGQLLLSN